MLPQVPASESNGNEIVVHCERKEEGNALERAVEDRAWPIFLTYLSQPAAASSPCKKNKKNRLCAVRITWQAGRKQSDASSTHTGSSSRRLKSPQLSQRCDYFWSNNASRKSGLADSGYPNSALFSYLWSPTATSFFLLGLKVLIQKNNHLVCLQQSIYVLIGNISYHPGRFFSPHLEKVWCPHAYPNCDTLEKQK